MKISAQVWIVVGYLVASVASWSEPSLAVSFADLPPEWGEVSLLNHRLLVRVPKTARLEPPAFGLMEAPEAMERQIRLIIDSGPLRLAVLVTEMFRVSPTGLERHATGLVKAQEEDPRVGQLSVAPSTVNVNGLEILEFEPRGTAKLGDANLIKGLLIRHPDASLQFIYFFINDPALADLPAARQLVTSMIASLKPGPRPLLSGIRAQLPGSNLVLDLLPGYTAYWQRGVDFDVYWIMPLVSLGQPAGRLGIYSGHHPQRPRHPDNAPAQRAVLFGADTLWYAWEGPANLANAARFHQEAFVPTPGTTPRLMRHVFFEAFTPAESADFQRMAETATFQ